MLNMLLHYLLTVMAAMHGCSYSIRHSRCVGPTLTGHRSSMLVAQPCWPTAIPLVWSSSQW
jgi:hypothetical protein